MRSYLPSFLKSVLRFLIYKQQRKKVLREISIRKEQNRLIKQFDSSAKKLIVFLVGGADWNVGRDLISGGAISIVSLCEETNKLKQIHDAEVIMATFPGQHLLIKHTQFENNTTVFRFSQLQTFFKEAEEILFHLPEFMCSYFIEKINGKEKKWVNKISQVNINILNQNVLLMPNLEVIQLLKKNYKQVTISTAHDKYCNQEFRKLYNVPLHKLSVWISPEQYIFKRWNEKENIILLSPDKHATNDEIIRLLKSIEGLKVQVIQDLTYKQYKALVARAKWSLTFGEGLDGYLIEPVFSGAIAFAIYNEQFFTPDFADLRTIYSNINLLKENIIFDIQSLNNELNYKEYQQEQYSLCALYYNKEKYIKNIIAFYRHEYSYG